MTTGLKRGLDGKGLLESPARGIAEEKPVAVWMLGVGADFIDISSGIKGKVVALDREGTTVALDGINTTARIPHETKVLFCSLSE